MPLAGLIHSLLYYNASANDLESLGRASVLLARLVSIQ